MILTALKELAEREGLVKHPDFQPVPVRWVLTIGPDGSPHGGLRDQRQPPPGGRGRPTARSFDVPRRSKRTTQDQAEFLVDKAEYVFGWGEDADRAARRHRLFVGEVHLAARRTRDAALVALARFFERFDAREVGIEAPNDWAEGDLIGIGFAGDPAPLISDRPAVRDFWSVRMRQPECGTGEPPASDRASDGSRATCLVTGEPCEPVRLHPKVKGIPPVAKTKGGVPLTSINASAFDSYGLAGEGCAAVAESAAVAYEHALNRLLADGYPDPETGAPMPRRNFRLSDDTVVVFWSKGDPAEVDLFSNAVGQGDPTAVEALYRSTWRGRPIHLDDPAAFYALTLTGGQGRGTVRGWHETALGAVLTNVVQYFADLEVAGRDAGRRRPLLGLLRQLAVQGKADNIPSGLAAELFASVLAGRPFPRELLAAAVRRLRADRFARNTRDMPERAALVKAYLVRGRRTGMLPTTFPEVRPMLDDDCREPAYRLGRLFAVLEKAQADATNASATIRDRYYGAASATPVLVFPQLLRKYPHHVAKLDYGARYERLVGDILAPLRAAGAFPRTLTLEQQGLFALGYYHQRQDLFARRDGKGKIDPPQTTPDQED